MRKPSKIAGMHILCFFSLEPADSTPMIPAHELWQMLAPDQRRADMALIGLMLIGMLLKSKTA